MIYAKVKGNEIVEYNRTLPFSTETTSFGKDTPVDVMVQNGYYPIIGTEPEYDRSTHRNNGVRYDIVGNEIHKIYDIVALTPEEIREMTVPKVLTPRQARLALLDAQLLDDIELAIQADKKLGIWWEYSLEIRIDNPELINFATSRGLTQKQIEDLFIDGSKL